MLEKKIRILIIVRWPGGGIRTFIRYVYRQFAPDQFQLTIISPEDPELEVMKEDLKSHGVEIIIVSGSFSAFQFIKAITKQVLRGNYKLVHSQGFTAGVCAALPVFLSRRPHILTPHDILNENQFVGFTGRLKKILMGLAFSMIKTIHCVSHDSRDNLLNIFPFLGKNAERCVVIRNGIEVERFLDAQPMDLRTELGVREDTFLIGFFGRFMSLKGFPYLIDAIEELSRNENLPKAPLVVAFGEGGYIREDKALIAKRGLCQFFRFLPFTPNVGGAIKGVDVVVMPSLSETCPLLPMETLVAGTPLIATNCIGLREVVNNTPTYVIPPKNSRALAEAIIANMKVNHRETFRTFVIEAANKFDAKNQASELKQLICGLIRS
jgi:glycosyltransferase involved in cell wall biosynthesis